MLVAVHVVETNIHDDTFRVEFLAGHLMSHNSHIQKMRRSSPACLTHLTSQSHAEQNQCNSRMFVVESLVVTETGEIQADATAAHHGPTAQAPPLNKIIHDRRLCNSSMDFCWDDDL